MMINQVIEQAAKMLAACMDYPWDHMPEQGRENMRKHAGDIVSAAVAAERERCAKLGLEIGGNRCDALVEAITGRPLQEWLEGPNVQANRPIAAGWCLG